ncbi:MAG: 50S ribosomal protein L24 [Kiritimatiellaceae bacterium]|jgi:large subunit ribosomal protein L24|nr:50S ribosomal protein L24 [Kiritimatiellaceae bacterium]|tara:strand:- start:2503 stop:2727 length:225 start_codon:yes stop_codon:yes gene_type:complete
MAKAKIKRGETVEVIAGDDKGKSGKVLMVNIEQGRVLVEGVNFVKKHMQKSEDNPQGGVVEREAPLAISNVKPA